MITAIDTNILLDILIPNAKYVQASKNLLDEANEKGVMVICEVVYAELASQFDTKEELDKFLADTKIRLENSKPTALYKASEAWKEYSQRRGDRLQCPKCGAEQLVKCNACSESITSKQHIISDFLIGGHALAQADLLLTRDLGYYRSYFRELKLKSPAL